jgi:hypothetical protein
MSSRAGSSIGTFLMSMPVSAMLLMGVFGIPRFAPGTGSESGWQNARQFFTSLTNSGTDTAPGTPQFPGSPLDPAAAVAAEAPAWGTAPAAAPAAPADWPFATRNAPSAGTALRDAPHTEPHPLLSRGAPASKATITWHDARRRLAELGIDQFHLEPGVTSDQYLFVCLLQPGGDDRVTQRFEAEAGEPLAAVEAVLGQIDGWLARRYAADNGPRGLLQSW